MFRRALVSLAGVAALFALSLPASAQPRHFQGKIERYVPSGVYLQANGGTNYIPWGNSAFFIGGQQVALTPQQFPPGTDIEAYSEQGTGPSDNQAPPPQAYFGPPPGEDQEGMAQGNPDGNPQDGVVDVYAEPRAGEEGNPYAVPNYNTGLYLGLGFGYPYWGGGYWGGGWGGYRGYYNGYRGGGYYHGGYNGYRGGGGYNGYRGGYNSGTYNAYRGSSGGYRGSYSNGGYRSSGGFRGSSSGGGRSSGGSHGGGGHGGGHR